jgi:hypothetical protein
MLRSHRSAVVAITSAAAGAAIFGAAAGGVVAVDDELRAVTPAARFETVGYRQEVVRDVRLSHDCPATRRAPHSPNDGEV